MYKCPIYESTRFLCDRNAVHLVSGTAICDYHAAKLGLTMQVNGPVIISALAVESEKPAEPSRWLCGRCLQGESLLQGKEIGEVIPSHFRDCPLKQEARPET